MNSAIRLAGVLAVGFLLLGGVIGSVWLAQADEMMTAPPSIGGLTLPTPTPYPADPPRKPVLSYPTATAAAPPELGAVTATPPESSDDICRKIPPGWVYYSVKVGDTFVGLAERGNIRLSELLEGNCKAQTYPLSVGEALYVPAIALTQPTATPFFCGSPPGWRTLIVQPGDTFSALARRYGIQLSLLLSLNCRTGDQTTLYAGEAIYVPPYVVAVPTRRPTLSLPTATPTSSPTATPLPTATPTETPVPSPTSTPTETPVTVPTWTATPPEWELPTAGPPPVTATPELTPTPSESPTAGPDPATTPTGTPPGAPVPSPTLTQPLPTASPEAPTPTATPVPPTTDASASPTPVPTVTTATPSPSPSSTPTPAP